MPARRSSSRSRSRSRRERSRSPICASATSIRRRGATRPSSGRRSCSPCTSRPRRMRPHRSAGPSAHPPRSPSGSGATSSSSRTRRASCGRSARAAGGAPSSGSSSSCRSPSGWARSPSSDAGSGSRETSATLLVIALANVAGAAAPAETPNTISFRAHALYGEERGADAAAESERVLAAGWESGNLYSTLGNAWFRAGDVGRAVLDYERTRRLLPRDPDVQANLSYARELAGDGGTEPAWARLVFPLAGRATSDELLGAASALYVAIMVLLTVALFVPVVTQGARSAAAVAGVALVVVLSSAGWRLATLDLPAWAVVLGHDEATVRFEPSAGGTAHFQAKPGTVVRLLGAREGWAQVERADGRRGWVEQAAVATI